MKRSAATFALTLLCVSAFAQKGILTTYAATWNGLQRSYSVYVPPNMPANPALVMCLHQTAPALQNNPPTMLCPQGLGWEPNADIYGFLLVAPIASWKASATNKAGGWFFWEAYNTDADFPVPPDDSGFLRSLIQSLSVQYSVDPGKVFVTGMSSGAMMTHRMGIDSADLVSAIGPVSGSVWVGSSALPNSALPVSVIEYHGDVDPIVKYCGGKLAAWDLISPTPAVDADVDYWLAQDGVAPSAKTLCSNGTPTANVDVLDFKNGNVEVEFIRELNTAHTYRTALATAIWQFFAAHGRSQ